MGDDSKIDQRYEDLLAKCQTISTLVLELAEEIQTLKDAGPTKGQNAKRLLDYFVVHWNRRYKGQKYVVKGAKDMGSLKLLLGQLDVDDVAARIARYFKTVDKIVIEGRHPLALFISGVNRYGSDTAPDAPQAVVGCQHDPRCRTEADHTRRAMGEMKRDQK